MNLLNCAKNNFFFFVFLFLIFFSPSTQAQCDKIYFVNMSMEFAINKAKQEKKNIFIFVYEVGEKKADFFQSAIFYKKEVCSLFNNNFINIKAKSNSRIGAKLIRKYKINSFPCFLIINQSGRLVHQTSAINSTRDLVRLAKKR